MSEELRMKGGTTYLLFEGLIFGGKVVDLLFEGLELGLALDPEAEGTLAILEQSINRLVRIESYASGARNRYDLPSFLLASLRLRALLAATLGLLLGCRDVIAVHVGYSF